KKPLRCYLSYIKEVHIDNLFLIACNNVKYETVYLDNEDFVDLVTKTILNLIINFSNKVNYFSFPPYHNEFKEIIVNYKTKKNIYLDTFDIEDLIGFDNLFEITLRSVKCRYSDLDQINLTNITNLRFCNVIFKKKDRDKILDLLTLLNNLKFLTFIDLNICDIEVIYKKFKNKLEYLKIISQ
ncbi:40555_t:CDS:1, partial [Gigaspora margarita]